MYVFPSVGHSCTALPPKFYEGELISLWLYKENNKLQIEKMYIYMPHTYVFVVQTSLTDPRKIILVVLQIGK
jgi:hypothetical protein